MLGLIAAIIERGDGAAAAGFLAGVWSLTSGASSPIKGRLADKLGINRVLSWSIALNGVAFFAVFLGLSVGASVSSLVVPAILAGATMPPVGQFMRDYWRARLGAGRERGYSAEAVVQEVVYICGPLVVLATSAVTSGATTSAVCAVLTVSGGVTMLLMGRSVVADLGAGGSTRRDGAGVVGCIWGVLAGMVGVGLAFGALDVFAVALDPSRHGFVGLTLLAGGSALGGVLWGRRQWEGSYASRALVLGILFCIGMGLISLESLGGSWLLLVLMLICGLPVAPLITVSLMLIDDLAPHGVAEAQGWLGAAYVVGLSAGASLAGLVAEWELSVLPLVFATPALVLQFVQYASVKGWPNSRAGVVARYGHACAPLPVQDEGPDPGSCTR